MLEAKPATQIGLNIQCILDTATKMCICVLLACWSVGAYLRVTGKHCAKRMELDVYIELRTPQYCSNKHPMEMELFLYSCIVRGLFSSISGPMLTYIHNTVAMFTVFM